MLRVLLLLATICLALAPQGDYAAEAAEETVIKGVVSGQQGAPLKDVKVIAFNLDTGVAVETKSGPKGQYELKGLPKGDYELMAVAKGYDMFGSEEFKVDPKTPVTYNIKMDELFERPGREARKP